MSTTFALGLELMLFGLLGVFSTLIFFILTIVALTKLFPYEKGRSDNHSNQ